MGWPPVLFLVISIVGDNFIADLDTLITDIHCWPGNQILDVVLRFPAERAAQYFVLTTPSHYDSLAIRGSTILDGESLSISDQSQESDSIYRGAPERGDDASIESASD